MEPLREALSLMCLGPPCTLAMWCMRHLHTGAVSPGDGQSQAGTEHRQFCSPALPVLAGGTAEPGGWPRGVSWIGGSGPTPNGCQKELLITEALSQIRFGGCRLMSAPCACRSAAPPRASAQASPSQSRDGEPVHRPVHLSGISCLRSGSLRADPLWCSVTTGAL